MLHWNGPPIAAPAAAMPPPPPMPIPCRPPAPCSVDSVTVRYTSTWRASPAPTAITALTTAASWAAPSIPPRVPVELQPQRVLHLGRARAGEPGAAHAGAGIGGEAVDVVDGEARVGDGLERGLDGEVEAGAVEPAADGRLPDARR